MITSSTEMLQKARHNGYAVPAFNTNNLEWTKAILTAAEKMQSPVIVQVTEGAATYMGGFLVAYNLIRSLHDSLEITVPVAIHLDHGSFDAAKKALAIGFTSVMFDGSALPLAENLKETQTIVEMAHAQGASVEAEVGTIGGEEDGLVAEGELAHIDDAVALAKTKIDMLAAGIGNIHGPYPDDWQGLDLTHLQEIQQAVDGAMGHEVPLVLHGGSGIPDEQVQQAIKRGVSKVNVNTEGQLAFHEATRAFILADHDLEGKNYDPRKLLKPGAEALEAALIDRIKVFGSANQA